MSCVEALNMTTEQIECKVFEEHEVCDGHKSSSELPYKQGGYICLETSSSNVNWMFIFKPWLHIFFFL